MSGEAIVWPWLALLLLGAAHGINPGMGWLFAVALGLQEGKGAAVWRALPPLALGHALAIGAAVAFAGLIGLIVPVGILKWGVAATLLGVGVYRLVRHRHPRYGGMRASWRDLTLWSFLMASAHGAGLMVLPLVLGGPQAGAHSAAAPAAPAPAQATADAVAVPGLHVMAGGHGPHGAAAAADRSDAAESGIEGARDGDAAQEHSRHAVHLAGVSTDGTGALFAALVHAVGYLVVTGLIALVVYAKLGLRLLRKAWINLDLVWALALIVTAVLTATM